MISFSLCLRNSSRNILIPVHKAPDIRKFLQHNNFVIRPRQLKKRILRSRSASLKIAHKKIHSGFNGQNVEKRHEIPRNSRRILSFENIKKKFRCTFRSQKSCRKKYPVNPLVVRTQRKQQHPPNRNLGLSRALTVILASRLLRGWRRRSRGGCCYQLGNSWRFASGRGG